MASVFQEYPGYWAVIDCGMSRYVGRIVNKDNAPITNVQFKTNTTPSSSTASAPG